MPFLKRTFHMLVANFTWWLNRKDRDGRNLFEGGFLGLDNIGVFDRSSPLPTGGYLEQADGTAWMAFYAQNMLDIALELALVDPTYEDAGDQVLRARHLASPPPPTASARSDSLWDEEDGFFYDVLRVPGQFTTRLKVRSIVGLLPLCAVSVYRPEVVAQLPQFIERVQWFNENRPDLLANLNQPGRPGAGGRFMLSLLDRGQAAARAGAHARSRRVPGRPRHPVAVALSPRAPVRLLRRAAQEYRVGYLPAESDTGMFGGNSNWRGPIWAPINALLIRALLQMYAYYGDEFQVECPTGSGQHMNLYQVAQELSNRLASIFLRDHAGAPPRLRRHEEVRRRPALEATTSCSTSTSTATTAPASAPATRPAGPPSSRR